MDKDKRNDHDILVEVHTIVTRLDKWAFNHDTHHFRSNLMAWTAVLGLVATLIVVVVKG